MFQRLRKWYYRRTLRRARDRMHRFAYELYAARYVMPEKEEDINRVLDKMIYPSIEHLQKLHDAI